jgi:hypothetical protein
MNPRCSLIAALSLALLLSSNASGAKAKGWKLFKNRAGWSIEYPSDWQTGSCHSCPDTSAPNVFVTFLPPVDSTNDGSVMVSPLQDKPNNISLDSWFADIESKANLNPRISEQRFTLNGLSALRVRYLNPVTGIEMEEVYVLSGSHTFSISLSDDRPGRKLENLRNYSVYAKMVESFKVEGSTNH